MKKLLLMVVMFCMASAVAFAQDTRWGVGLNIGYGTDVSKPFLGAKAHYNITEAFTVAGSFNHYFKETVDLGYGEEGSVKCWDINADLHWNVYRNEMLQFYPLVGLTYLHAKASAEDYGDSEGKFGVNLGVGALFDLSSNWAIGIEAKYQIIDGGQFVPMATIMYKF